MAKTRSCQPAVLLVADRTLSADYRVLLEGIFATMQTTAVPAILMQRFLAPRVSADSDGRADLAPLGVRRVESALLAHGTLSPDNVACATPETLGRLIGPWTKIVGVSSSDPLGRGMSNTTMRHFQSGRLYTQHWTDRLMQTIRRAKDRHHFHVVAGGAGAWQWAAQPDIARQQGIDTIFEGSFEHAGPALFDDVLAGRGALPHVREAHMVIESVQPISAPAVLGAIELSRGCGNGCEFCLSASRPMIHLPSETILADIRTNVRGRQRNIVNTSEDFFRYGSEGGRVNPGALIGLLEKMHDVPGVRFMQLDQANVASVLQFNGRELNEIRRLLSWPGRTRYLWVNLGVESANGQLVADNGPGKLGDIPPDHWEASVLIAVQRLAQSGFFSTISLVLGLPGEKPADVTRTRRLVDRLSELPAAVFPVFYEPIHSGGKAFGPADMTPNHVELFRACHNINARCVPKMFWDNQRAGGVALWRRLVDQVIGQMEMRLWRRRFIRLEAAAK